MSSAPEMKAKEAFATHFQISNEYNDRSSEASCIAESDPLKQMTVIEFLMEYTEKIFEVNDINLFKEEVKSVLIGKKVRVTHRETNEQFCICGLSDQVAKDVEFHYVKDALKMSKVKKITDYYKERYNDIKYQDIPLLRLGESENWVNLVPMEFCLMIRDEPFQNEQLTFQPQNEVKKVDGCVMALTKLNLRSEMDTITVNDDKSVGGVEIKSWALVDFSGGGDLLDGEAFISSLRTACISIGLKMEYPAHKCELGMSAFDDEDVLCSLIEEVMVCCDRKGKGWPQIIVCIMARKHSGYKFLKRVTETQFGVLTQCCLSRNMKTPPIFESLATSIKAKLGGTIPAQKDIAGH